MHRTDTPRDIGDICAPWGDLLDPVPLGDAYDTDDDFIDDSEPTEEFNDAGDASLQSVFALPTQAEEEQGDVDAGGVGSSSAASVGVERPRKAATRSRREKGKGRATTVGRTKSFIDDSAIDANSGADDDAYEPSVASSETSSASGANDARHVAGTSLSDDAEEEQTAGVDSSDPMVVDEDAPGTVTPVPSTSTGGPRRSTRRAAVKATQNINALYTLYTASGTPRSDKRPASSVEAAEVSG